MKQPAVERRRMRRLKRPDEHRITAARIRPGHIARIVDVSAVGALVESAYRLLPGASVELHVQTDIHHVRVRGEVLRASVATLRHDAVCYRGAIRFDRHLPWFVDETGGDSSVNARPAYPRGEAATQEVL